MTCRCVLVAAGDRSDTVTGVEVRSAAAPEIEGFRVVPGRGGWEIMTGTRGASRL